MTDSPPAVTYAQSARKLWATFGGGFLVSSFSAVKAYAEHETAWMVVCEVFVVLLAILLVVTALSPARLTIDSYGVRGARFGKAWIDLPWQAITQVEVTWAAQPSYNGPTIDGRRIAFKVTPDYRDAHKLKLYDYVWDGLVPGQMFEEFWDICEQCERHWKAAGAHGVFTNKLTEGGALARPSVLHRL